MKENPAAQRLIRVRTRSDGTGTVEAAIADRGCGISPDEQDRLLQPFFMTKSQGLGLGLSICSSIVTSHGGELRIGNNSDRGATAIFRLPIQPTMALEA